MEGPREVFLGHRLREEHQTVKPLLDIPVQETRSGAEGFGPRHQPKMRDAGGGMPLRHQIANQQVISLAPAFGRDHIALRVPAKPVARPHRDDLMPRRPQPRRRRLTQTGFIDEDQPDLRSCRRKIVDLDPGLSGLPVGRISPIRHIGDARRQGNRFGFRLPARLNEIRLALEGIGRERHAMAGGPTPDRLPVHGHTASPQPRDGGDVPRVVGHLLFRMPQRRNDLRGRDAIGLRQRGQRTTRAHLDINPRRFGLQRRHAGLKIHRSPQVGDPILGVRRLLMRESNAGAVRDDRQRRRA